jgi:hypothetical protein
VLLHVKTLQQYPVVHRPKGHFIDSKLGRLPNSPLHKKGTVVAFSLVPLLPVLLHLLSTQHTASEQSEASLPQATDSNPITSIDCKGQLKLSDSYTDNPSVPVLLQVLRVQQSLQSASSPPVVLQTQVIKAVS